MCTGYKENVLNLAANRRPEHYASLTVPHA